jgi:uncharacterized protein (UPF0332 family)
VSPRSAEFFDAAERRLAAARRVIGHDAATAISLAYYAMFYAARAALSERDMYARTHAGTWDEFQRVFVAPGLFDGDLLADARRVQREREDADYEAWVADDSDARRVIDLATRFLDAVRTLIDTLPPR